MHEHNECEHEFKYCSKCDVVYCTKCNKEWTKRVLYTITTSPYMQYSDGTVEYQVGNQIIYNIHNCYEFIPHS